MLQLSKSASPGQEAGALLKVLLLATEDGEKCSDSRNDSLETGGGARVATIQIALQDTCRKASARRVEMEGRGIGKQHGARGPFGIARMCAGTGLPFQGVRGYECSYRKNVAESATPNLRGPPYRCGTPAAPSANPSQFGSTCKRSALRRRVDGLADGALWFKGIS